MIALAQRREIDAVLVTELSRWGRSTVDLLHTLEDLQAWRVSVIALNGLAFDLSTAAGRMMATIIAGVAQFERELIQERERREEAIPETAAMRLREGGEAEVSAQRLQLLVAGRRPNRMVGDRIRLDAKLISNEAPPRAELRSPKPCWENCGDGALSRQ